MVASRNSTSVRDVSKTIVAALVDSVSGRVETGSPYCYICWDRYEKELTDKESEEEYEEWEE